MQNTIKIYSRCSYDNKLKAGAYGAIIVYSDGSETELSGPITGKSTNNRAELTGIIRPLHYLVKPYDEVHIYTNSSYIQQAFQSNWIDNWINNGWKSKDKKTVKNKDLFLELNSLLNNHGSYTFKRINKKSYNNRAKELANQSLKDVQKKKKMKKREKIETSKPVKYDDIIVY